MLTEEIFSCIINQQKYPLEHIEHQCFYASA
jgi:hypothetical protein